MKQEEKTYSFTFQDIQALAYSIIGVWLLSTAIPAFIQFIAQIILIHSIHQRSGSVFQNSVYIPQIAAAVLKIALGIYLFSGGKGLIRLWKKFDNTRGLKPSGNNEKN